MEVISVLQGVPASISRSQRALWAGLLVGLREGSRTIVISTLQCDQEGLGSATELAESLLPPPLAVVGCYAEAGSAALISCTEPGGVAISVGNDGALQYHVQQGGSLAPCQPELLDPVAACTADGLLAELAEGYVPVRCVADLVLAASSGKDGGINLLAAYEELEEQLCGPGSLYVAEATPNAAAAGNGSDLPQAVLPASEPFPSLGATWSNATVLRPYQRAARGGAGAGCAAPQLSWQPGEAAQQHASLCLDVLCYVPASMPAAEAVGTLVRPAVRHQLRAMRLDAEAAAAAGSSKGKGGAARQQQSGLQPQRALHFRPPGYCHHITLLYPLPNPSIEAEEEALLQRRQALHRLLSLPPDRPLLRVANAVAGWSGDSGSSPGATNAAAAVGGGSAGGLDAALAAGGVGGKQRLRDVHVGLPPPPLGGSVHLVQGSYDYYHYMQDKFDDSGWGCAYRSLQTLCSWFTRQHYTTRPPPSHRQVQAALVAMGDKPASFVGSRQWIGAIEIGYVLDSLLGVGHKVLTAASGDDLPSLARQIAHHFDTQGSPIMIGGGVLAYTLLGIDWEEGSGRCAFLILDPHYTGGEDVRKIHAGQWVAWKQPGDRAAAGGELFVSGSFYNLLCPQRPTTV